ncbi:MAG: GYD domain-containing protein [Herpetosiphonaceae bacterium]|nr:MAG: GYD domain-containing protein [Herpetosiphonaceae bacterium]
MALYAILARLTEMGQKDIKGMMERRSQSIRQLEENGIRIVADYALMGGEYDFLYIVEAADNEVILRQIVKDTQSGMLKFQTLAATRLDLFAEMVRETSTESDRQRSAG